MKKWFTVFCMALLMLAISGCGSDNALDSYSFGHKVIKSGNSEITVALPYDIGVQPNTTKNALGYPVTTYLGADKNFLVSIEAISPKAVNLCRQQRLMVLNLKLFMKKASATI